MTLRAMPEHLMVAGVSLTNHGENMASTHALADARTEAAQAGWQGLSAVAMQARSQEWLATTNTLLTQLSHHAQWLHLGAQTYVAMEDNHAAVIDAVRAQSEATINPTDL